MLRFVLRLWICLLLPVGTRAASSLEHARTAAEMVGAETWSRVLKIENTRKHGSYPATVYALVFEFGGILWFYTDTDGTQSFSLCFGGLAAEKADFAPLLRAIEPGFARYVVVPADATRPGRRAREELPNGCFIESVASLRQRVARGDLIVRARLLSFYGEARGKRFGHTVLAYETPSGAFVVDPQADGAPVRVSRQLPEEARVVAQAARPEVRVTSARWVPTDMPKPPRRVAANDPQRSRAAVLR